MVILQQEEGAVLWHCSMGKDRVGVGTALLLYALGVPMETIMEDYLRTNRCLEEDQQPYDPASGNQDDRGQ